MLLIDMLVARNIRNFSIATAVDSIITAGLPNSKQVAGQVRNTT